MLLIPIYFKIKKMYFVLIHLLSFLLWSVICYYLCSVDLSSWARKLSEQEKGEEEGILYEDYGSPDESEGISQGFISLAWSFDCQQDRMCCFFFFAEEEVSSFEEVEHNDNILTLGLVG